MKPQLPSEQLSHIESLISSQPLTDGVLEALALTIRIMARLRGPGGCPWDAEQTHESLLPNLLEETHEVIHAVQSGDISAIREELGDLLLQVIFHAQIASEEGRFDLSDVARDLTDKLIRRHPHVFGDVKAANSSEAIDSWNRAKRSEGLKTVSLGEIPPGMPALLRARKVVEKAGRVGFEWHHVNDALKKLNEEVGEFQRAIEEGDREQMQEELGDVLFVTACVARYIDKCPEIALTASIDKFMNRFRYIENKLAEEGLTPEQVTLEKMDGYWDEAKKKEK